MLELLLERVSSEDKLACPAEVSDEDWDEAVSEDEEELSDDSLETELLIDDEDSDDELACPVGRPASPSDRFWLLDSELDDELTDELLKLEEDVWVMLLLSNKPCNWSPSRHTSLPSDFLAQRFFAPILSWLKIIPMALNLPRIQENKLGVPFPLDAEALASKSFIFKFNSWIALARREVNLG